MIGRRRIFETIFGALVVAAAITFGGLVYSHLETTSFLSYSLNLRFSSVQGLKEGAEVRIAGVKVGKVRSLRLEPTTLEAQVTIEINSAIDLPEDSEAEIATAGLLGENFLRLKPGNASTVPAEGDELTKTREPLSLEELLGKAIFALSNR